MPTTRLLRIDMSDAVLTSVNEGVLKVVLNRPEVHNAFNSPMVTALTSVFRQQARSDDVRVVVLSGNGPSFCAGADVASMRAAGQAKLPQNEQNARELFDLMLAVNQCPRPVIGSVHGAVFGGGTGLVSCCDIVVAAEDTVFAFSEVRLGLIPAVISPFVLAKVGEGQARELFLTGERFDAYHAQKIGLVHRLAPQVALAAAVEERVQQLMQAAPGAQTAAKALIRDVVHQLEEQTRATTARRIAERRAGEEGREGLSAFLEKRRPSWQV